MFLPFLLTATPAWRVKVRLRQAESHACAANPWLRGHSEDVNSGLSGKGINYPIRPPE